MYWTMSESVSSRAPHRESKSSSQYHSRFRTGLLKTNSSHCSKVALIGPIVPGLGSQLEIVHSSWPSARFSLPLREAGFSTSQPFQKSLRPLPLRKQFLLRLKFRRMHAPSAPAQLHRMLQMQHFVVHNVFHRVAGNQELIKDSADHNRIMRRVVVP